LGVGNEAICYAAQVGYQFERGEIRHPDRTYALKLRCDKHGYRYFRVRPVGWSKAPMVYVHRYVAYLKFGEKLFDSEIVVRHLDGDKLNNSVDNIAIGTQRQNALDRPEIERLEHAKVAGKARRRLSKSQAEQLRIDQRNGASYSELQERYGVSRGTVSHTVNKKFY